MHVVLYRKYRPKNFQEVVGQKNTLDILNNAIAMNKISHAYLFHGSRGTGKTSIAKIFARTINCENLNCNVSCGTCESCLSENHPDIIEIDAATNNGVDEIRTLKNNVSLAPLIGKYKVYIIDEAHMLTTSAFNALLKTLEEPPKHVVFILATTEPNKIIETVYSRCQVLKFSDLSINDLVENMKNIAILENINITDSALVILAVAAKGGARDSLSLLEMLRNKEGQITDEDVYKICNLINPNEINYFINNLINNNIKECLTQTNIWFENGKGIGDIVECLVESIANSIKDCIIEGKHVEYLNNFNRMFDSLVNLEKELYNSKRKLEIFEVYILTYNSDKLIQTNINLNMVEEKEIENVQKKEEKYVTIDRTIFDTEIQFERVNNTLTQGKKEELLIFSKLWDEFCNSDEISSANKQAIIDTNVCVVGGNNVVVSCETSSQVMMLHAKLKKIEKNLEEFSSKKYNVIAVTNENWNVIKSIFIEDIKKGITYSKVDSNIELSDDIEYMKTVFGADIEYFN